MSGHFIGHSSVGNGHGTAHGTVIYLATTLYVTTKPKTQLSWHPWFDVDCYLDGTFIRKSEYSYHGAINNKHCSAAPSHGIHQC